MSTVVLAANETFDESPLPELDSEALDFRKRPVSDLV